jgi:hypothetical protein
VWWRCYKNKNRSEDIQHAASSVITQDGEHFCVPGITAAMRHRPSNSVFCSLFWVHSRLHIYPCRIISLPWHRHSGKRNLGFMSHLKDKAIEVKWLALGHKQFSPHKIFYGRVVNMKFKVFCYRVNLW